ncbi:MAG: ERF family protein [Sphingomicrobium sp.]
MSAPSVYAAINAVSAELAKSGIAKASINEADDYNYRSIDDMLDRLAPLLAKHRLCVLPQALEREATERRDDAQRLLIQVVLRVAFTLTSVDDGSSHVVEAFGEALDASDKATAKAMTAAFKSAMVQAFCIPVRGTEDPDRTSPRPASISHLPEPVQGWDQWCDDIVQIIVVCESEQAIDLVQERNRDLLKAVSRERPGLYRGLGECFTARRRELTERCAARALKNGRPSAKKRAGAAQTREVGEARA